MDKKEFAIFVSALKTYYPRETLLPTNAACELWYRQLSDLDYNVAMAGLIKWVLTNKWSPSIADIREMAVTVVEGDTPDYGEAWGEVQRAIRRYGSFRPEEALNSMSNLTRMAAERIGFINLCMSENPVADRAQFEKVYKSLVEREKKDKQLTQNLRERIAMIQAKSNPSIGSGEAKRIECYE